MGASTTTPNGGPDAPYRLRVQRCDVHHEAHIRGAVGAYFGHAAERGCTVTSRDGQTYRVAVPNLGPGSTCYRVEWI